MARDRRHEGPYRETRPTYASALAWSTLPNRPVLVTILTTGEIVYVVILATWILFEKRPPVATLAWILALVGLPYVGFVVFFFLGPRRLVRKRLRQRRARGKVRASATLETRIPAPPGSKLVDARFIQLERL